EKKAEQAEDTTVPVEKVEDQTQTAHPEDQNKKGFLDKIKEKLPGGGQPKKTEEAEAYESAAKAKEEEKEKKGFLDKIKEKIPGYHSKTEDQKDNEPAPSH
ncbi:hypothetical protein HG533_12000, partial [Moraxella osloensis]